MSAHFLIRYTQAGSAEQREALRGQHIAFRKGLGAGLALAGPLLAETGEPVGSVVIIAADDTADASKIAHDDPYVVAGVLQIATIERLRIAAMVPPVQG